MNTANLGLNLVIALHEALIAKGAVSRDEPSTALERADRTAIGDYRSAEVLLTQEDGQDRAAETGRRVMVHEGLRTEALRVANH